MKSEVYSWRLEPEKKADLEAQLRRQGTTLAKLLDDLTNSWLRRRRNGNSSDEAEQSEIRKRAMAAIGSAAGGDPTASGRSSALVREAIYQKYLKESNAPRRRVRRRAD